MVSSKKSSTFAADLVIINGAIAQLVEQRTENPCVPGSIPGGTTERNANDLKTRLLAFFLLSWTSNLATFDQHFDTFSPFLMLKKSVFRGYYNTKKEGQKSPSFLFRTSCPHLCHLQQQPFRHTRPMNTLYNLYTDLLFYDRSRSFFEQGCI